MITYECNTHGVQVWDFPEKKQRRIILPGRSTPPCELTRKANITVGQIRGCEIVKTGESEK